MRVAWVHPSWRDLVIEHLARDRAQRAAFLTASSIHGVLLARSAQGGADGTRALPLLTDDGDWDSLTDRVHTLVPSLETIELIALLDTLARTHAALGGTRSEAEATALAHAALARAGGLWNGAHAPVPVAALVAWLALAGRLTPRPSPPLLAPTWAELLPVEAPDLRDHGAVDRFADWLTLAEALSRFDEHVLSELGLQLEPPAPVVTFIDEVAAIRHRGLDTEAAVARALDHIGGLFPYFAQRSPALSRALMHGRLVAVPTSSLHTPGEDVLLHPGGIDVRRVLEDLW